MCRRRVGESGGEQRLGERGKGRDSTSRRVQGPRRRQRALGLAQSERALMLAAFRLCPSHARSAPRQRPTAHQTRYATFAALCSSPCFPPAVVASTASFARHHRLFRFSRLCAAATTSSILAVDLGTRVIGWTANLLMHCSSCQSIAAVSALPTLLSSGFSTQSRLNRTLQTTHSTVREQVRNERETCSAKTEQGGGIAEQQRGNTRRLARGVGSDERGMRARATSASSRRAHSGPPGRRCKSCASAPTRRREG